MNIFKTLVITIFLYPLAIRCDIDSINQIKELTAAQNKIAQELSALGKAIAQQEQLIIDMSLEECKFTEKIVSNLNKSSFLFFTDRSEEIKLRSQIHDFVERFNKALREGNIKDKITSEFTSWETNLALEKIKSYIIRRFIEKIILRQLFKDYEFLFQEGLEIETKINELECL